MIKELNIKHFSLKYYIWLIILVAYSSNILGYGKFIPILLIPYCLMYLFNERFSKTFMITLFILLSFTVSYSIMLLHYGYFTIPTVLGRLIFPIILFIIGNKLSKNDIHDKKTTGYLISITVASALYGFLSLIKSMIMYGNIDVMIKELEGRFVINLWNNGLTVATGLNSYLSLGLSLLPLFFLGSNNSNNFKANSFKIYIFCFIAFSSSFYTMLSLGNRTGFLIVLISFIIVILFVDKFNMKKVFRLLIISLLTMLSYIIYSINTLGIKENLQNSFIYNRFISGSIMQDPRTDAWKTTLFGIFKSPLGGRETDIKINFAHNLWLDVGYDAGIIPFSLIVLFTLVSLYSLIVFIKSETTTLLKGLVLALYTAFFITFMVEPILQGLIIYFTLFCFVLGVIQQKNHEKR